MTEQQAEIEELPEPQTSPGQSLREAREASGLSQQALADKIFLKITVIQQLEADEFNPQTSMTFTKGYIRLYAKHVGLDPEPLLIEFDRLYSVDKPPQTLQSFSRRVSTEANDHRWMMVTYVILAVVIALVVVWWYQQSSSTEVTTNAVSTNFLAEPETTNPNVLSQPRSAEASADTQLDKPIDLSDSTPASQAPAPLEVETETVLNDLTESVEGLLQTESQPDTADPQTIVETVQLEFTFADDCWVNIVDASGEAIAYGVKVKGRVMPISGIPPFAVTLGAPQVVSISYAGEAVDLSAIPAGQIARFELPMQE